MKAVLLAGVVVSFGEVFQNIPPVVLVLTVFCGFGLVMLALTNDLACNRLIRILKVLLNRDDDPRHPNKRLAHR